MSAEQLGTLLELVYGCHGTLTFREDVVALRRTSPSAGGLHPIEAYPLVRDVAGLEPGLYHYAASDHCVELVRPLAASDVADLAEELTCGQSWFRSAHVLFVNVARFDRTFWKYRRHPRAYATLLLDAGHLSQTLYLVATELGLGAFVTAAINGANAEEALRLDPYSEGALAITGCGVPAGVPTPLEPVFEPYSPTGAPGTG
jgi:putative peptide maturation dehydrogenase